MKHLKRVVIYICGIFIVALGGVLSIKSNLGASPVSSLPLSISRVSKLSLGTATILLFTFYVLLQIILLRKKFRKVQLLQIIFAMLFGQIMNFFNSIININVDNFYIRITICLLSFFITALGVFITITANVVPIAPDGLVQVISSKRGFDFGKGKIYFDCVVVLLSITLLLINRKSLEGLGIGTILSAILVGRIVFIINKHFKELLEKIIFS